jgi:hypothetical protein
VEAAEPRKCRVHVEEVGDDLLLRRRTGNYAVGGFLFLWLTVWTAGCVSLAGQVAREPTLEHILFALPFWSSWLVVSSLLAWLFFGSESLRIGPDGLDYESHAWVPLKRGHVPLREIRRITHYSKVVDSEHGRTEHGLTIETLGRPVRFGQGLDPIERLWLAERVRRHIQALVPDRTIEHRPEGTEKAPVRIEVLRPGRAIAEPPSDSRVRYRSDRDRFDLVRRGSFSLVAFGCLTFCTLFWNGGVGVFLIQLSEHFDWFQGLFLLPFVVVGLGMFLAWWGVLLAPLGVERWGIGPGEMSTRYSVLGMGRTRRHDPQDLGRIELRRGHEGDTPYTLVFAGRDGRDLLSIDGLTEGEALWIGGLACDVLKGGWPKDGGSAPHPREEPGPMWDREMDG